MAITRREFLERSGAIAAWAMLPTLKGCGPSSEGDGFPIYEYDGPLGPDNLFAEGVASGDPLADSVILWTRVTPPESEAEFVRVFAEVSENIDFKVRVATAYYAVDSSRDHCLKLDVTDLEPATTYYYRFQSLGRTSPVGRTRTAPSGEATHLRFAVASRVRAR